jgi:hypothetical protein
MAPSSQELEPPANPGRFKVLIPPYRSGENEATVSLDNVVELFQSIEEMVSAKEAPGFAEALEKFYREQNVPTRRN